MVKSVPIHGFGPLGWWWCGHEPAATLWLFEWVHWCWVFDRAVPKLHLFVSVVSHPKHYDLSSKTMNNTVLRISDSTTSASTNLSSDTGSETGSDVDDGRPLPIIDLTQERLQSLHALGKVQKSEMSTYAKKGMSASRIKKSATAPRCECMCRMPVKILYHLCVAFWTLAKPTQDALLWGIQHEGGHKKNKWMLAGQDIHTTPSITMEHLHINM